MVALWGVARSVSHPRCVHAVGSTRAPPRAPYYYYYYYYYYYWRPRTAIWLEDFSASYTLFSKQRSSSAESTRIHTTTAALPYHGLDR